MEIKHQMIGSTLLFKCHDPVFNEVSVIQYKRNLAALVEKNMIRDIVLDVENIRIADNFGLGALLFARRYTRANGNNCILAMPRPKLISLLKAAKLAESFTIIYRREEYQAYLKMLVEKQDQEKAEREAERARKADEVRKAEEAQKTEETRKAGETQPVADNTEVAEKAEVSKVGATEEYTKAAPVTRKPRRRVSRKPKNNGNGEE